jgi:predicted nucleic acid-binding protein
VIVADTGAVLALIDADDGHHATLTAAFRDDPSSWVLPWAVLPEVDYLLGVHLGSRAQETFLSDLGHGEWLVDWGGEADLRRANEIATRYKALRLGLVDAAVIAAAERLRATAIATLDLRHFGSVTIRGRPRLIPRDL